MEKYILFAGHCYYAEGGASDFRGFYNSIEEAKEDFEVRADEIKGGSYIDNWGQIVDRDSMKILYYTRASHIKNDYDKMEVPKWNENSDDD